ncbi:MAG: class I SAM-dependent methyltransferase, partial [Microgenomates group bacterium]
RQSLARYEFASRILKKGAKILDLGCGTGYGSNFLLKEGFRVVGIDINKEAISFASKHYPQSARFLVCDVCRLPFDDLEFDAVCSFEVIEHIEDDKKMLSEVVRVLKKGGIFIMSTPKKEKGKNLRSPYHIREYTKKQLENLLREYFTKVEIKGQFKSLKAKEAFADFLKSQEARKAVIKSDVFGLRKILPRNLKEKIWPLVGNFFGRGSQEKLKTSDFPVRTDNLAEAEFLIAVCKK